MGSIAVDPVQFQSRPLDLSGLGHETITYDAQNERSVKRRKTSEDSDQHVQKGDAAMFLFRHTPASTKKHTRPPMSKLFSSIELLPEQFLQLQAAAKNFMLDDAFPERRDTVGVRGKGDTEIVKLRLWNCAQDFVEREGNGEKFFGANVPSSEGGPRSMIWPQDKTKIIKALIPLLRRVITNERQRQYALETRNKAQSNDDKGSERSTENDSTAGVQAASHCRWDPTTYTIGTLFNEFTQGDLYAYNNWRGYAESPEILEFHKDSGISKAGFDEILAIMDHHLRCFHSRPDPNLVMCSKPCENSVVEGIVDSYPEIWEYGHWRSPDFDINPCDKSINVRLLLHELFRALRRLTGHNQEPEQTIEPLRKPSPETDHAKMAIQARDTSRACTSSLALRVTLLEGANGGQDDVLLSRREISAADTPYLHTLLQRVCQCLSTRVTKNSKVYVHLPDGLVLIEDDKAWAEALKVARNTIWFDGLVNVVMRVR